MNKTLKIKILVDMLVTILFVLLMDMVATGLLWHEILGITIFVLFVIHNILNRKWFAQTARKVFAFKAKGKTAFLYLLNIVLILVMALDILSGLFISVELLPALARPDRAFWYNIHQSVSYISLILISIHIGMHWTYIMGAFRKMTGLHAKGAFSKFVLRVCAGVIAVYGIISMVNINIIEKIAVAFHNDDTEVTANGSFLFQNDAIQSNANAQVSIEMVAYETEETESFGRGRKNNIDRREEDYISKDEPDTVTDQDSAVISEQDNAQEVSGQSLEDYLSTLHCNLCGRMCSLLAPSCSKGAALAQEATDYYYSTILSSSDSASTANSADSIDSAGSIDDSVDSDGSEATGDNTDNVLTPPDFELETNHNLADPFINYLPIMGFFIAGTYYSIQFASQKRNKN